MINYETLAIFNKDYKRLAKKYRSLDNDLKIFKDALEISPTGQSNNSQIVHDGGNVKIVKSRLFCRYLKGQTLRIVYAFHQIENKICFIEIYFKGNKENENRGRIREYIDNFK